MGRKRRLEVSSGNYDSADFFEGSGKSSFELPLKCPPLKYKTFTEKSFERWSQYVCSSCKHLVFHRDVNTWVCDRGHSITKEQCVDWVDDIQNIRIRMPNGSFMYLSREES